MPDKPHSVQDDFERVRSALGPRVPIKHSSYPERVRNETLNALQRIEEQFDVAMDCMNYAWTIICNVSEGDWTKQSQEWQDAAARYRDQYHALLASNPAWKKARGEA